MAFPSKTLKKMWKVGCVEMKKQCLLYLYVASFDIHLGNVNVH
ncbi:hypothetical protein HMPREF9281_01970 [Staphylococcus epidermidis BVS058A4]|nr:hypothetical protein HMPREF9281_01970 [Staphylococcus epidermidis BVS058A4]